ncbi:MAG: hypothetical protein KY476_26685, partial [Planctomycetes bacterium]|nr:hypothetical protein [Planctomycetota bacterium]
MTNSNTITSVVAVAVLAAVHLFAGRLRFLDVIPRSRWLSIAGGVSVAYAALHLLPELGRKKGVFAEAGGAAWMEHSVYLLALAGLVVFYGLEKLARER